MEIQYVNHCETTACDEVAKLLSMKTFGGRLRALREARNWSQEKLGFDLGVTKATISKWESDQVRPRLDMLLRIKTLFADEAISLDFLSGLQAGHKPATNGIPLAAQDTDPRLAQSQTELMLLMRFRSLSRPHQQALIRLLTD